LLTGCHALKQPALGLILGNSSAPMSLTVGIQSTAIGRASEEVAVGPQALAEPPSDHFPDGMPIIDPGSGGTGDPGNSYLLYKVLMAPPMAGTGGAPQQQVYSVTEYPFSDAERQALAALIPGREMPFPTVVKTTPRTSTMTFDQMQQLSLWIAQGANVPQSCP
jgi:hypothetical protein